MRVADWTPDGTLGPFLIDPPSVDPVVPGRAATVRPYAGPQVDLSSAIRVKRVYEPVAPDDGRRVLVDHVWPRGLSRERARLDEWARELAPSDSLRRWFDHDPERFTEFRSRYHRELGARQERLEDLCGRARAGRVTIVYAARDEKHNNGVALGALLVERLGERDGGNPRGRP